MSESKTCERNRCRPKTHPKCDICKKVMPNRWDCDLPKSRLRCNSCSGMVCEKCCEKVKKMTWQEFYIKYIELKEEKGGRLHCIGCGSGVYSGEGFVTKISGKLEGWCGNYCRDSNSHRVEEDPDWDIWKMHPPELMLEPELTLKYDRS